MQNTIAKTIDNIKLINSTKYGIKIKNQYEKYGKLKFLNIAILKTVINRK